MVAVERKTTTSPHHGGLHLEELSLLGLHADDVLDFSVNVNPYGLCPEMVTAVRAARIDRYPDPHATAARRAIAQWACTSPEAICVANGAAEILWAVARATLTPHEKIVIAEPAFSEMRSAALRTGAHVVEHRAVPRDDFAFDVAAFARILRAERPRLAYVASPSNPSGARVSPATLARLAEEFPSTQLVVDASFAALSTTPEDAARSPSPRVLWVRSLTKELALPGLRVGFAAGPPSLVAALHAERPPWSVSAPAEAAAIAAATPGVRRFVEISRQRLLSDRARIAAGLAELGLRVHPGDAPYVLVDLGATRTGAWLRSALLERHRILVRDAASFGLPHHVRVAARDVADSDRLLSALRKELSG